MNKNIIIGIVVVIALAFLSWMFFFNSGTETTVTQEQNTEASSENNSVRSSGTLDEVFTQGGNYTCNINTSRDGITTEGVIYSSDDNSRVDLRIELTDGSAVETHVVRDGTFAYTWVAGQTTGFKSRINASTPLLPQPQGAGVAINDDETFDWDCHPWLPEAELLVAPSNVTFTTI